VLLALLSQLLSYSLLAWLTFVAVTLAASAVGRGTGMILGHCLIAAIVVVLDVHWVQAAMASPTYDPNAGPDFDIVFPIGVVIRIILINSVLLQVACAGLWLHERLTARYWRIPV
jgi:hypothetical protein